jgi:hypothetical protein
VLLLGFLPQSQVMRGMGVFCAIFGFRSVAPLVFFRRRIYRYYRREYRGIA